MEILAARRVGWRLRSTRINRWRTNDGDGFNGAASKMRADAVALAY
jgi:hypothetical protein